MIDLLDLNIKAEDITLLNNMIDCDIYWAIDRFDNLEDEDEAVYNIFRLQTLKSIKDILIQIEEFSQNIVPRPRSGLDKEDCIVLREIIQPDIDEAKLNIINKTTYNDEKGEVVAVGLYPTGSHTYPIYNNSMDFLEKLLVEIDKLIYDGKGNCVPEDGVTLTEYLGLYDDEDEEYYIKTTAHHNIRKNK